MLKKAVFSLIIILLLFFTLVFFVLRYISINTNTELFYFSKLLLAARQSPTLISGFNFIVLGLDPRNDSLENTQTTDTIIMSNLSPSLKLNLISFPRDLWFYPLNIKINQIYPISLTANNQFQFIQNQFQLLTGQNIDRIFIITTENLVDLVNLIGGVDVYLQKGFKDTQYPNPLYIASPSAKVTKFITIEFPQGNVRLDADNVSGFVRSRKSSDFAASGGTDIGRIERQQLLIDAILNRLKSYDFLNNPQLGFRLYHYFHTELKTNFTDIDLMSIFIKDFSKIDQLTINKIPLTSGDNPKTDLLYHPGIFINSQWVFLPQDKNYQSLWKYIYNSIQANQ